MKNRYVMAEYAATVIFLVIPPVLVKAGTGAAVANGGKFSPYILLRLIIAIFLYYQQIYVIKKTPEEKRTKKNSFRRLILFCSWSALCLGLLMLTQALVNALILVFPSAYAGEAASAGIEGSNPLSVTFNLLCGAFYEEVLYREFLPENLVSAAGDKKYMRILCETACVTVFAMAHRYMGPLAVLNALLCGIILRICRIRSASIWAGTAAHFIYNALLLAFSLMQK